MNPPTDRVFVTCKPCNHTWIAAYLPMELTKAAKLMGATRCPKCAGREIYIASKAEALSICEAAP